jgi:hypothetical protein
MQNNSFRLSTLLLSDVPARSKRGLSFLPGLFFIALGLLVVFAPRLLIGAVAAVFVFIGLLFCYAAWKVVQFKRKLRIIAKDVEAKFKVEEFQIRQPDIEVDPADYKKIVVH